jgi:hypothetical protein
MQRAKFHGFSSFKKRVVSIKKLQQQRVGLYDLAVLKAVLALKPVEC